MLLLLLLLLVAKRCVGDSCNCCSTVVAENGVVGIVVGFSNVVVVVAEVSGP